MYETIQGHPVMDISGGVEFRHIVDGVSYSHEEWLLKRENDARRADYNARLDRIEAALATIIAKLEAK